MRRIFGTAFALVLPLIACGSEDAEKASREDNPGSTTSSSGGTSGGAPGSSSGGTPVGDPATGNWTDLGHTHAPDHAAAIASNLGAATRGGTLTFTNIGATGYWGRRIDAQPGDARCDMQSETIDFGWGKEFCCRQKHEVSTNKLSPFNEQLAMVLDGPLRISQLAVYQPLDGNAGPWAIRSFWDRRKPTEAYNLKLAGPKKDSVFTGDLGNSCTFFAMQDKPFKCGPGSEPYCPGSDIDFEGWPGSKLVVMLASMPYADDPTMKPLSCKGKDEDERATDSPWIGISPSELNRDGWSGYHPCHCFNNTSGGQLGDGCGQINVFEVVAESSGPKYGNRDVISTGIRSFQVGSLGGVTCGIESCGIDKFPADADLLDVNSLTAMKAGAVIDADHRQMKEGPAWRRAQDDRYYVFLLDEDSRTVQVAVMHPGKIPATAGAIVPALPNVVARTVIDDFVKLRLPQ